LSSTSTQNIDSFSFAKIEKILNIPENNEYIASLGLEAARHTENLPDGTRYVILAYKKIKNSYIFHKKQDFIVGKKDYKIELDNAQNYTFIIVSMGTETIPKILNENDFDNVSLVTNFSYGSNERFLYQRIDNFIPIKPNNTIDIKLVGSANMSVIVDTNDFWPEDNIVTKILQITGAKINYNRPKMIGLKNRNDLERENVSVPPNNSYFMDNMNMKYRMDFPYISAATISNIKFQADSIKVDGDFAPSKIEELSFSVKYGYQNIYVIKPMICGAYLGPNETKWTAFMCHNLGGNNYYEGMKQKDVIVGNRYAWGGKDVVYKKYDNPPTDAIYWEPILGNDPCPTRYRIPTRKIFSNMRDYNIHEDIYDSDGKMIGMFFGPKERSRLTFLFQNTLEDLLWTQDIALSGDKLVYAAFYPSDFWYSWHYRTRGFPVRCYKYY